MQNTKGITLNEVSTLITVPDLRLVHCSIKGSAK